MEKRNSTILGDINYVKSSLQGGGIFYDRKGSKEKMSDVIYSRISELSQSQLGISGDSLTLKDAFRKFEHKEHINVELFVLAMKYKDAERITLSELRESVRDQGTVFPQTVSYLEDEKRLSYTGIVININMYITILKM